MLRPKLAVWVLVLGCALLTVTTFDRPAAVQAATVQLTNCDNASLTSAIASAGPGGTVTFGCSGTISLLGPLTFRSDVTLDATGQTVTLTGPRIFASPALNIQGATVAVTNLTVSGGNGGLNGGGIDIEAGTLTLTNCTVSGNHGGRGGGIFNKGTLTLTNSTISGNSSTANPGGGGIYNDDGATLALNNSTVSGNSAQNDGGGIFNNGGTVTLSNSTVSGNSATNAGGGIFSKNSGVTLSNSTVSGNTAQGFGGGGIVNENGSLTLITSIVSGNSAALSGGGIFVNVGDFRLSASMTLSNSTVSNNTAGRGGVNGSGSGGGIFNNGGTVTLTASTVSGNTATEAVNPNPGSRPPATGFENFVPGGTASFAGAGAGIYNNAASTMTLTNSTVSGNSVTGSSQEAAGGGIENLGTLTLTNSTVSGNSAPGTPGGGGIGGTATLTNSIVAGNSGLGGASDAAADCTPSPAIVSGGHNVFGQGTGCSPSGSDVTVAPAVVTTTLLGPLARNGGPTQTMALLPGSRAIDLVPAAGAGCPATDQRGAERPHGAACDAGAVEEGSTPVNPTTPATRANESAQANATTSWAGTWNTDIGVLTLMQNGNQVTGAFQNQTTNPGAITGTVNGNVLTATWDVEPSTPGMFTIALVMTQSTDGKSFTGTFDAGAGSKGTWSGTRTGP